MCCRSYQCPSDLHKLRQTLYNMEQTRRLLRRLREHCNGLYSITLLSLLVAIHGLAGTQDVGQPESLSAIHAGVARLRADARAGAPSAGLDHLQALEYYTSLRAYPNDTIDWDALKSGIRHRDAMDSFRPKLLQYWEYLGPKALTPPLQTGYGTGKIAGRINDVAFDPNNSSTVYAAAPAGGVWKTTDSGSTWTPLTDAWSDLSTSSITVDPHDSNTIYVGTGDFDGSGGISQGVMRSTNAGLTWTSWGPTAATSSAVRRILVDPEDSTIVTVITGRGSSGTGQVWRTDDSGDTWTAVITASASWDDLVCSAKDASGNRTYYACAGGTNAQVWKSADRGATWTQLTVPMRTGSSTSDTSDLAVSPVTPGTVYLLGTGDKKVWRSLNNGANWQDMTSGALASADWSQASYDFYITCSTNASNDVLYVGLVDLLVSVNSGTSWTSLMLANTGSDLAHVYQHRMAIDPNNASHSLLANDGGIYSVNLAANGTGTFTSLNTNLGVTQLYWGDLHPTDATRLIAGSFGQGTPASFGSLSSWTSVTPGNAGQPIINQNTPAIQYSTLQYFGASSSGGTIGFYRTPNNWTSITTVSTDAGSDRIGFEGPIVFTPNLGGTLLLGTNYLYKYTEAGNLWTPRLGGQQLSASSTITSIAVTTADNNLIYTGSGDGQLWITRNGGTNWSQINTGAVSLPNKAFTGLKVQPGNGNDVLVGLSGSGDHHLWRCADTSASTRTWIDVSGTGPSALPDAPINAIALDPVSPTTTWFVGTDIGVFKTSDGGSTWMNITSPYGLPNVQVTSLTVRNGYLYATTFGRGWWRLNTSTTLGVTVVSLTLDPTEVIGPTSSLGTVTLNGAAPTGGVDVALNSSDTTAATVPATVHVDAGETSATFTVSTLAVETTTTLTISGSLGGNTASAALIVDTNGLSHMTISPRSVLGGATSTGTVFLGTASGDGTTTVNLTSSDPGVASVPSQVTVLAGKSSAMFTVTTYPTAADTVVTITATLAGTSVNATITVTAAQLSTFKLAASTILGGHPTSGTVTLTGKAPSGGAILALTNSNPSIVTIPSTVTVPANTTTASFSIATQIVSIDTPVTLTATYLGIQKTAILTVATQKVASLSLNPNPVIGGNSVVGTLSLAGPAAVDLVVNLTSGSSLVQVPSSVTVPAGSSTKSFTITTRTVTADTSVDIFATANGSTQQVTLVLQPMRLIGFTLSSNRTYAGQSVTGTVSLNGAALSGGAVVALRNSNSSVATVPTSVTIPQGSSSKTFTITTNSATTGASTTITATRGTVSISQILTVTPIELQGLSLNSYVVTGGASVSGVVRIPIAAGTGGYVVALSSSDTSAVTLPASVTIAAGATSKTFTVTTKPVPGSAFVTIRAAHGSSALSTQLQVLPPEVSAFHVSPTSTRGGNSVTGTLTLTGKAPQGGIVVHFSANPNLASPGVSMLVRAGATSLTFRINTTAVSTTTPVSLTVWTFSQSRVSVLTLTP